MEQYNKASDNEKIRMLKILIKYAGYQSTKTTGLQEESISGTASGEKLAKFQRRWNELGRSTKEKTSRANPTNSALQNEGTTTAGSDTGDNHCALARALKQLAERSAAQKKEKQEAKRNKPWRNVPQYYAKRA